MSRPTINDIAEKARVSTATVSRVLSQSGKVRESTRERVMAVITEYSYIPNHLAKGLAGSPTKNLGIIIDELSNFFFIEIAEGVDSIIANEHYSMQLMSSRWIAERELQLTRTLISNRVEGVLIAPVSPDSEAVHLLKRSGIPFVVMNCTIDDPDIAYVSCDNVAGGRLVAEFINRNPREQTILVSGFEHQSLSDRVSGFREHHRLDISVIEYRNIKTFEEGKDLIPILLNRNSITTIKTTLFVTNDNVALGIIDSLTSVGVRIPEQVSVIGYDDIRLSAFNRIPLTTVSQSIRNMGRLAAIELFEMIRNTDAPRPHHLMKPELIFRDSAIPEG